MNHYQPTTSAGTEVRPGVAVLRGRGPHNVKVKRTCIEIICEPAAIFLVTTILVTALATALLYNALTSRYWEMMIYDEEELVSLVDNRTQLSIEWFFEGRVSKITNHTGLQVWGEETATVPALANTNLNVMSKQSTSRGSGSKGSSSTEDRELSDLESDAFSSPGPDLETRANIVANPAIVFLLPLHSGVWISCIDITEQQFDELQNLGYHNMVHCVDHLNPDLPKPPEGRKWQHRMQNLAIACAMVCLILLGAAVVVGLFGILSRQISAILVTGVIYVLAALFALFTLTIVHLKDKNRHEKEMLDVWTQLTPDYSEYSTARNISHGWSLTLGWAGSFVCVLASIMWILLSKIMRYNPISFFP
ncbi:unnamed protein product [Allacma fusca]|uniref:Uncharacterized protein n=1 Tax=Allacma fusca TaxID=39272 RepID=A0A8J2KC49_9HEXA|nr:unnamed protein product [Allacma fusca]